MVLILMVVIILILLSVGTKVIINGKLITNTEKTVNGTNNKIAQEQLEIDEMMGILTEVDQKTCTHQWGEWKTVREPTCLVEGEKYRICTLCDKKESAKIATVAHTVSGIKCTECSLSVGDYINYIPAGTPYVSSYPISNDYSGESANQTAYLQDNTKWRILNIAEDGLEIISASNLNIGNTSSNTTKMSFRGVQGYNNGVELLNEMCDKLYGTGKYATKGRSINVEDIKAKLDETVWKWTDAEDYGEEYILSSGYYPIRWEQENISKINGETTGGTLAQSDNGTLIKNAQTEDDEPGVTYKEITAEKKITITNTNIRKQFAEKNFINQIYYNLFFPSGSTKWFASRCNSSTWGFTLLKTVTSGILNCNMWSGTGSFSEANAIQPIVKLEASISLEKDEENSTDKVTYWNFIKE